MANMINKQIIKQPIVMKRKSEPDSKAGTSRKEKIETFKNVFSKSASMLLIMMTGLSAMSFVQDDSFVSGSDTNQSAAKVKHVVAEKANPVDETCCLAPASNTENLVHTAYFISTPGKKAMYKADKETIVTFISEAKERRIWSMNKKVAAKEADGEMHFNFQLSAMYPSFNMVTEADKEMSSHFVDEIVNIAAFGADVASKADKEVASNFISANLPVNVAKPSADRIARADAEIITAFQAASRVFISIPSAAAIQKADQEIIQNYKWQAKPQALK